MTVTGERPTSETVAMETTALRVPLRRLLRQGRRQGPLGLMTELGREADGRLIRLSLGSFKPFLVTHPEHLECILRSNAGNYPRGAAMWQALGRLTGDGIGGEGPRWALSRASLQPGFAAAHIRHMGEQMVASVTGAVDDLAAGTVPGQPVDAGEQMTAIVQRVIDPVFFGRLIPEGEGGRLGEAVATAMSSLLWRMAMPQVPHAVPLPGDRAFKRATRTIRQILRPVLAQARQNLSEGDGGGLDVVSMLMQSTDSDGRPLTDQQITDDICALFVAGSESSAIALTWVWVALAQNPQVHALVRAEVDRVVGDGPLRPHHGRELAYTGTVLREVLRVYSVGWAVPRIAVADDEVGGVLIPAGSTLVLSPYLTHRLPQYWPDPLRFDPSRFTREQVRARAEVPAGSLAYLPFGDGAHACLGEGFFYQEAALVIAEIVRRFEVQVTGEVDPRLSLTVQPRGTVQMLLTPRR
ncbi:cytochrome P450 [Spirillospora sp. NPDC127200]